MKVLSDSMYTLCACVFYLGIINVKLYLQWAKKYFDNRVVLTG